MILYCNFIIPDVGRSTIDTSQYTGVVSTLGQNICSGGSIYFRIQQVKYPNPSINAGQFAMFDSYKLFWEKPLYAQTQRHTHLQSHTHKNFFYWVKCIFCILHRRSCLNLIPKFQNIFKEKKDSTSGSTMLFFRTTSQCY